MNRKSFAIKNEKGQFHCEDGPAVGLLGVSRYWYLNSVMMDFDVWLKHIKFIKGDKYASLMRLKWEGK